MNSAKLRRSTFLREDPELGVMSKPIIVDIWFQWRWRIPGDKYQTSGRLNISSVLVNILAWIAQTRYNPNIHCEGVDCSNGKGADL